jgi:hypothetical protein
MPPKQSGRVGTRSGGANRIMPTQNGPADAESEHSQPVYLPNNVQYDREIAMNAGLENLAAAFDVGDTELDDDDDEDNFVEFRPLAVPTAGGGGVANVAINSNSSEHRAFVVAVMFANNAVNAPHGQGKARLKLCVEQLKLQGIDSTEKTLNKIMKREIVEKRLRDEGDIYSTGNHLQYIDDEHDRNIEGVLENIADNESQKNQTASERETSRQLTITMDGMATTMRDAGMNNRVNAQSGPRAP